MPRSPASSSDPEDRLRLLAGALPGCAYEWDLASDVVTRDPRLSALLGVEPDEVAPGASWWSARIHPETC